MKKLLLLTALSLSLITPSFALSPMENIFSDLSENNENFDAIKYVKEKGIVNGYSDGTFKGSKKINRVEFLKIVLEAKKGFDIEEAKRCINGQNLGLFNDVESDKWFSSYVCYAKLHGFVKGYPDGSFKPSQEINLPEMAKIISLTQNLKPRKELTGEHWYLPYLEILSEKKAIPDSVSRISHLITRGEMAEIVYRIKENVSTKKSATISELVGKVQTIGDFGEIGSCTILGEIMNFGKNKNKYGGGPIMMEMEFNDFAGVETKSISKKDYSSNSYSKTNIQVEGVDEADIIKNDGRYIYLIKGNQLRIVDTFGKMKEIANIKFKDENFRPAELFLSEKKLVAIGRVRENQDREIMNNQSGIKAKMWYPQYWGMSFTKVISFDISNKSKPKLFRESSFEGNYSKSRRIGEYVYLVINKVPDYYNMKIGSNAQNLLPRFKDTFDTNGEEKSLVSCNDIRFFPGFEVSSFVTIASINIEDKNKAIGKKVMLGSSENIYMSKDFLYIATGVKSPEKSNWSWDNTKIYKFGLNKGEIKFDTTGVVKGRILNQFSMDEFDGDFRIATTTNRNWREEGDEGESKLFILDSKMEELGKIEGIAPGERIKSVRFLGNKAYLVTFKNIDPFFVIDLKDTKNPKILGELKIPGWSDYLHPYDENHLIGFGKETKEPTGNNGTFTWRDTLGMKISIFDVSDLKNPKEKFKYIIGDRGTNSELLRNHKALLFDKEKNLISFPIEIKEEMEITEKACYEFNYSTCPTGCEKRCTPSLCTEGGICTQDCDGPGSCVFKKNKEEIRTTFAGGLVLNIDLKKGISERGRISNNTEKDYQKDYFYENWTKKIKRIIYIGENLYSISENIIKSADIKKVEENGELELKSN